MVEKFGCFDEKWEEWAVNESKLIESLVISGQETL